MRRFLFDPEGDIAEDIREGYGYSGDLLDIYVGNTGTKVHKWHHYIPLYARYLDPWRGKPLKFLEIGVNRGGSLQMWRNYFGPEATIFGIDINPMCAQFDGQAGQVRIGSQVDTDFLDKVVEEMGGVDIILDDGSHHMDHVAPTLQHLFPKVSEGGLYMIEDLHTAYIRRFGGGLTAKSNFFNTVRKIVDDMHAWYHRRDMQLPELGNQVGGVHVYDSMVILEKRAITAPRHSYVGAVET